MIAEQGEVDAFLIGESPQCEHRIAGERKHVCFQDVQLIRVVANLGQLAPADAGKSPGIEDDGFPRSPESVTDSPCWLGAEKSGAGVPFAGTVTGGSREVGPAW